MTSQDRSARRIVVGVDGSDGSRAALRWAADEASAHGGHVEAVCAWEMPFSGLAANFSPAPTGLPNALELSRSAEKALDQTLQEVLGDQASTVERVVLGGDPAAVLLKQSRGADMLVVGSRGQSGFNTLLIGSISEKCVRHASCTVVVVRPSA